MRTAVIADDHSLFLFGLSLLLREEMGFGNVIEASSLPSAVTHIAANPNTELAFIDLYMPGMEGAGSLANLKKSFPKLKIVMLTASENLSDAKEALAAGANGYIPKSLPEDKLVSAIRTILRGEVFQPPLLSLKSAPERAGRLSPSQNRAHAKIVLSKLTPRQREIFDCICMGLSNKQIAEELNLSENTVSNHVSHLLELFDVRNRTELAILA